ncbi:MAG: hypothetical protein IPJ74_00060 [Saprospiraceae bacterium]|nr:hypothetical protein [Saprospiraceae bacterium]
MKKIFILLIIVLTTTTFLAQTQLENNESTSNNNMQNNQNYEAVIYRLFPTQNMWTFIKLNTRNGRMWQVQYDVKGDNRLEARLSLVPLVTKEKEANGRFTLYPTQNIYTFILLDQLDGRTWQVQWSIDPKIEK